MSEDQKQPFNVLAESDKARYARQKQEFDSMGYFTLDDGTKSTEKSQRAWLWELGGIAEGRILNQEAMEG